MKHLLPSRKTLLVLFFGMLTALLFQSCIGDKVMLVSYQVHNRTNEPLYLPNTLDNKGGELIVAPNEKKTVYHDTYVCWMGDCRMHMELDGFLDSISVFQDSTMLLNLSHSREDWKLRKSKAVLTID